jgi:uncharacterized protein (TIGR03905 family)
MAENIIQYEPQGVCSQLMQIKIEDNVVKDIAIHGGCHGNLQGIRSLIIGMNIDDIISKLEGIDCRGKGTSCPDQLAKCLIAYKNKSATQIL